MEMTKYRTSAGVQLVSPGAVTVFQLSGVVTVRAMPHIASLITESLGGAVPHVLVFDVSSAVIAVSDNDSLAAWLKGQAPVGWITLPIALVVPDSLHRAFCTYAWMAADLGYVRAIFTSPGPALTWAELKAQARFGDSRPASAGSPSQSPGRSARKPSASGSRRRSNR